MLLCNTVAPLTANALLLSDGDGDGMFLPVPRQLFPTSNDSMNTSISSPNRVQVSPRSIFTPIPHQLFTPSHPSLNESISSPNRLDSWVKRTPYDLWNQLFAISRFLNIPKNLIVPQTCLLNVCPTIVGTQRGDIIIANAVNNARILGLGGMIS
jgi:hypothetical protein